MFRIEITNDPAPPPSTRWFVVSCGDTDKDPLDKYIEEFECIEDCGDFCGRERNKGTICFVYKGLCMGIMVK